MGIRYADAAVEGKEFVERERSPTVLQLLVLFVFTLATSIGLAFILRGEPLMVAATLTLLLTAFGWYMIVQVQRTRDLVLATEFQNALFTSALGSNNKFCIIIKNNGVMTYMDGAFHELFDDFVKLPYRHIDAFLKFGEVTQDETDKILAAIDHNVNDSVVFTVRTSDNKQHKIMLNIEPITRPAGYILLRARDFVDQRSASTPEVNANYTPSTSKLNPGVVELISGVVDDKSAFVADAQGILVYVSPLLEEQLGYGKQEMLSRNFSIQDFVYVGGSRPDSLSLEDYTGEIILQKKDGNLIKCHIEQKLIHDKGKLLGCSAVIDNNAHDGGKKKIGSSTVF